ncbi:MAG: type II toxin-antitoxin system RelE/ParE family toxin [Bacteroidales bacterium]
MNRFKIKIVTEALADIQEITTWYNEQQASLGKRFQTTALKQINSLAKNPHIYSVRYNKIRCMIIKRFPYMVHFYIDENNSTVEVLAVISTGRHPRIWLEKTGE